jgi:hypothetical protein
MAERVGFKSVLLGRDDGWNAVADGWCVSPHEYWRFICFFGPQFVLAAGTMRLSLGLLVENDV